MAEHVPVAKFNTQGKSGFVIQAGKYNRRDHNSDIAEDRGFGTPGGTASIYEKMDRTCPMVRLTLNVMFAPLLAGNRGFRFPPGVNGDPRHLALCEDVYGSLEGGMGAYLEQAAESALYGFMPHEVEEIEASWSRFLQRMPWSIVEFHTDNERLAWVKQQAQDADGKGLAYRRIEADRMLWSTHRLRGDHYTGESLFRPAYGAWKNIMDVWRFAGIRFARMATPLPTIHLGADDFNDDVLKDDLSKLLENMVADISAHAILPETANFQLHLGHAPSDDLIQWARYNEWQILSLGLAQFLALGTSATGNRSVGDTQARVYFRSLTALRDKLVAPINDTSPRAGLGTAKRLIDNHFGPQKFYPRFYVSVPRADTLKGMADGLHALAAAGGYRATVQDNRDYREELFLAPMTPEEEARLERELDETQKVNDPRRRSPDDEQPPTIEQAPA